MKRIPSRTHGLLEPDARSLIRNLIGQSIDTIWSPSITASFSHLTCRALSFIQQAESDFLVLDGAWEEDEAGEDYGWFTVSMEPRAKGVAYSKEGLAISPSGIDLTPSSPIARITLFRKALAPALDWVFDHALLFEHEERFRYLISYEPDVLQQFVVSFSERAVAQVISGQSGEPI